MTDFTVTWLIVSYVVGLAPVFFSWTFLCPKTAARITLLLYPFAPITFPLFAIMFILYGIYFVIRTAIGGSTTSDCRGMGGGD